jgi:hypothetical protein
MDTTHETPPVGDDLEERAALSSATINDLPDSAFAYIEPGGKKDNDGKTVPRSLRHFPVHDEAHARNALAQASKSPFGDKAMPKILKAAKKFGIDAQQNSDDPAVEESQEALDNVTNRALTAAAERRKKDRHRSVPLCTEVRHFRAEGLEVRENSKTDELIVSGEPIVYSSDYTVTDALGQFTERMAPGVAADVLPRADVRFLFNHDGLPLARTTSGTMSLQDSDTGLRFTASLDARQQLSNDLAIAIQRGDVSQMSCGFIVAQDEWDEAWEDRTIQRFAELLDVSAVTYPASPTTSISVAQRMMLAAPVESRARIRKAYVDVRAGKVLSADSQSKLVSALGALHDLASAGGVDLSQVGSDDDAPDVNVSEDGSQGGGDAAESGLGADGFPLDGTRSADLIAAEPGEPIATFHRAKVAVDHAWIDTLVESGENVHGEARKRAA